MDTQKIIISGGKRLEGEIRVHGAKNSALPLLSAAALTGEGECVLHNCPRLTDVDAACRILNHIGVKCRRDGSSVITDAGSLSCCEVPVSLMREMRSSIVFLGAVLGRMGRCRLSFPGGCELGPRPIDLHLAALREMGAEIKEEHGYLDCSAPDGLKGADISLVFPSVGATENIILAAALAKGITTIHNAAREPEIAYGDTGQDSRRNVSLLRGMRRRRAGAQRSERGASRLGDTAYAEHGVQDIYFRSGQYIYKRARQAEGSAYRKDYAVSRFSNRRAGAFNVGVHGICREHI